MRDSMRRVWYSRWFDAVAALGQDMRVGLRSLRRAKGLAATVVVTLALGIGANTAIFSVVRGVLLRPLVNRDETRLIYIRQSATGLGAREHDVLGAGDPGLPGARHHHRAPSAISPPSTSRWSVSASRAWSTPAWSSGSFFEVMGLRPVLGRLLDAGDDGPEAAGAAVLTHRFWTTALDSDPTVIGRAIGLGPRTATVVGVLEPSVPYPADTEIIANVVTSPHHLGATMVTGRTHRMTELFGRLAPGATLDEARAELTAVHAAMIGEHPDAYSATADMRLSVTPLREQIAAPARTVLLLLLAAAGVVFVIACSNVANLILARSVRREGELAVRAALGAGRGALRRTLLAESLVLCGAGAVLGVTAGTPAGDDRRSLRLAVLRARPRGDGGRQRPLGRRRPGDGRGRAARVRPAPALRTRADRVRAGQRRRPADAGHQSPAADVRDGADRPVVRPARRRRHAGRRAPRPADRRHRL